MLGGIGVGSGRGASVREKEYLYTKEFPWLEETKEKQNTKERKIRVNNSQNSLRSVNRLSVISHFRTLQRLSKSQIAQNNSREAPCQ